jgi:hypothetical protein
VGRTPPPTISRREERARTEAALARLAAIDNRRAGGTDPETVVGPARRDRPDEAQRGARPEDRRPHPAPGHRRIEWVGEASPFDNPVVVWGLATGRYTPLQAETIRAFHRRRIRRGIAHDREMTKDRDGMSRDWLWGPSAGTYVRLLPNRDADRLLSCPSGPEFRDLDTDGGPPIDLPPTDLRQVKEAEYEAIVRDAFRSVPAGVRLGDETRFDAFSRSLRRDGEFHLSGTGWGDD